MTLTDADRRMLAKAREVAALKDTDAMRKRYGDEDGEMARAAALGEAQFVLLELVAVIGRLEVTADAADAYARQNRDVHRENMRLRDQIHEAEGGGGA